MERNTKTRKIMIEKKRKNLQQEFLDIFATPIQFIVWVISGNWPKQPIEVMKLLHHKTSILPD